MAETTRLERFAAYFVTSAELSPEERQRRSTIVRRMAWVQIAAVVVNAILYTRAGGPPRYVSMAAAAGLLVLCGFVIWLANSRRPVEGAWVLVLASSAAVALLTHAENLSGGANWPSLTAILFIWPIVVAGLTLAGHTVYIIAGVDLALFLLLSLLPPQGASTSWPNPFSFFLHYGVSMTVTFLFVAYATQRSAASLAETVQESEQRAQEILTANENLMEKSIQQVQLATQLGTSAVELSATSRQQASGSAQQASAISEVTSTIEEMGYTARQIAQSAENVAQVADQTLQSVGQGHAAVDETVSAMEGIKNRVQELADKVLALGEHSQRIGEIIEIINDIADETHLLALNAAIESATAGEHGRRFAVVAAEVKNLANRSIESSKEVRGIIAEIQQATNASVMAAEEGLKETERGVRRVYEVGRAMEQIVMLAQRTSEAGQEISLATTQQRTASEQIVETMREVAEVANQTADGSRQLAEAATMLSAIAERLQSAGQSGKAVEWNV